MSDKKKVLIITYYWPPSGGSGVQRWVKFCKYLPSYGIKPIVLTVKNGTYPLIDDTLNDEVSDDLKVFYSKSIEPYSLFGKITGKTSKDVSTPSTAFSEDGSFLKKLGIWVRANLFIPDARIGWVPSATKKASQIISDHNINSIITSAPPNSGHLIGLNLKKKNPNLQWIMDMRDPWSQIFYNQELPRTKTASKKDISLEKQCLSIADEVIVVSESMEKVQKKVFNRSYKIISNGFDHEDFIVNNYSPSNDCVVIKYVGSMTEAAIPHVFFQALSELNSDIQSKIRIYFFGSFNEKVRELISNYEIDHLISFNGYVPHKQAKKEMQSADLLLLVIPKTVDNELIITGKIFDYIGAQKPILCIGPENGDAAKLIRDKNYGVTFGYDETGSINSFLNSLITKKQAISYNNWEQDLKEHNFSRFSLTKQIVQLISNKV